jgi:hypothetical protein
MKKLTIEEKITEWLMRLLIKLFHEITDEKGIATNCKPEVKEEGNPDAQ